MGITVYEGEEGEQVLMGEHDGIKVIVLSVKPDEESAKACWGASCALIDTGAWEGSPAVIVDIAKATVRHGYITEM